MRIKTTSGIYQIQSKIKPTRLYIGSAVNISNRWSVHLYDLKRKKHSSILLQRHINKYGIEDLNFSILEQCNISNLLCREQYYIDQLKPYFNISKKAGNRLGLKHSEKTKQKMSKAHMGRQAWNKGKHLSEQHKLHLRRKNNN